MGIKYAGEYSLSHIYLQRVLYHVMYTLISGWVLDTLRGNVSQRCFHSDSMRIDIVMLHHTKGISFFDCGASDSNRFLYFLHFTFLNHLFCVIVFMDYQVDTCIKFGKSGLAFAWFKRQLYYKENQV